MSQVLNFNLKKQSTLYKVRFIYKITHLKNLIPNECIYEEHQNQEKKYSGQKN